MPHTMFRLPDTRTAERRISKQQLRYYKASIDTCTLRPFFFSFSRVVLFSLVSPFFFFF